jgi:oleate hydratase
MDRRGSRSPTQSQAYLIGSGIASLAAAVHLIQDAGVPPANIHILESGPLPGGSMDATGGSKDGYVMRGGRMLNFSYVCLYELLANVPSLTNAKKSVLTEIQEFNALDSTKTNAHARLVASTRDGPRVVDVKHMGMTNKDRLDLIKMTIESEKTLGRKRIDECFPHDFFRTNFWYMWATM